MEYKLSTVEVVNLRLRAYIGFIDWEKVKLQDLVISYSFKYDSTKATESDDVAYAVDYKRINKGIIALVENQSYHLIETVADLVLEYIQNSSPYVQDIHVQVEKPNALRFTDNVMVKTSSDNRYNNVMIALGSNIDAEVNFEKALDMMQDLGTIIKRTEFIVTKALKYEDQPDFLNGAVILVTSKSFKELSLALKQIETRMGRVRTSNKNAPRIIDLDISVFNNFVVDDEIDELPFLHEFVNALYPDGVKR